MLFDSNKIIEDKMIVKPLQKQKDIDSRKVWHPVTFHLRNREFQQANKAKEDIEEKQRERRKSMNNWKPKLFQFDGKDWRFIKQE